MNTYHVMVLLFGTTDPHGWSFDQLHRITSMLYSTVCGEIDYDGNAVILSVGREAPKPAGGHKFRCGEGEHKGYLYFDMLAPSEVAVKEAVRKAMEGYDIAVAVIPERA